MSILLDVILCSIQEIEEKADHLYKACGAL